MTDEVAGLVLRDNYEQNVLLGNARKRRWPWSPCTSGFMRSLEARRAARPRPGVPASDEVIARPRGGGAGPDVAGVRRPRRLLQDRPDRGPGRDVAARRPVVPPGAAQLLPAELVERYGDRLQEHPLRREIVTTVLVNEMVNRGGHHLRLPRAGGDRRGRRAGRAGLRRLPRDLRAARLRARGGAARQPGRDRRADGALPGRSAGCWTGRCGGSCRAARAGSTSAARSRGSRPWSPSSSRGSRSCSSATEHKTLQEDAQRAGPAGRPGAARPARRRPAHHLPGAGHHGDRAHHRGRAGRGRPRLPHALGPVQRRRPAQPDLEPAARRPLAGAGPGGDALRPLRRARGAHRRGPHDDAGGRAGRADRGLGAEQRRRRRPGRATLEEVGRLERGDLASLSVALRTLRGVVRSTA